MDAATYPIYEVGSTEDWDEQPDPAEHHVTAYTAADKVSPAIFGLAVIGSGEVYFSHAPDGYPRIEDVPLDLLVATQEYVYADHVKNLATVPQDEFIKNIDWDGPEGVRLADGRYLINEGHHRGCAAGVRGDKTLTLKVTGVQTT